MEKGLLEKTGKTLEAWVKIVHEQDLDKYGDIMKYLKGDHGMTHGFANFVSLKSRKSDAGSMEEEDLIAAQYSGDKGALKPIYQLLRNKIAALGDDVEFAPKKANVSCRRKKQFALIQPSTKTRVDLGLKLKGKEVSGRLESSGPFGAMCTHRIQLTQVDQVDEEVISWIKEAYQAAN